MDGKQLRNSILQWAIQGKLVPQDPHDEPASVLLERIREEKARLVKEKKIKRDKNESIIYRGDDNSYYEKNLATGKVKCIDDELPFEIPGNWQWERWGNISLSIQYGYNAPAEINGTVRMVRISDIQNGEVLWNSVPFCYINDDEIPTYELKKNDILFARTGGTVGKSFLVKDTPFRAIYAGYLIRTRYSQELVPQYLKFFMESQLYWEQLKNGTIATAQPNCNGKTLSKMFLPIPPKSEQARIVKMLGELKPFFDKFEDSEYHLRELNTKIKAQLKQSILQQAIQGLLVEQNPDDEPASVLLERITAEKRRLINEKIIKRDKQESIIYRGDDNKYYENLNGELIDITDQIPFDVPQSWRWVRLKDIGTWGAGATPNRSSLDYYTNGIIPWLKTGELNNGVVLDSIEKVTTKALKECSLRMVNIGDVLIAMYGATIGKLAIAGIQLTTNQACCACTPFSGIYNWYLFYYLMANKETLIEMGAGGAQPNISREKIVQFLFALPPENEQHRIVSKIEKLIQTIS